MSWWQKEWKQNKTALLEKGAAGAKWLLSAAVSRVTSPLCWLRSAGPALYYGAKSLQEIGLQGHSDVSLFSSWDAVKSYDDH